MTSAVVNMMAPAGYMSAVIHAKSGSHYIIDANGFISGVQSVDINDLQQAGFTVLPATQRDGVFLGKLIGANFNITTDQQIPLSVAGFDPVGGTVIIEKIMIVNASHTLASAVGGFYSASSKGGTPIVAANQGYTSVVIPTHAFSVPIAVSLVQSTLALYLSLTTAEGAAATADIYVFGTVLS